MPFPGAPGAMPCSAGITGASGAAPSMGWAGGTSARRSHATTASAMNTTAIPRITTSCRRRRLRSAVFMPRNTVAVKGRREDACRGRHLLQQFLQWACGPGWITGT
jgi:hypothetical protein